MLEVLEKDLKEELSFDRAKAADATQTSLLYA